MTGELPADEVGIATVGLPTRSIVLALAVAVVVVFVVVALTFPFEFAFACPRGVLAALPPVVAGVPFAARMDRPRAR